MPSVERLLLLLDRLELMLLMRSERVRFRLRVISQRFSPSLS